MNSHAAYLNEQVDLLRYYSSSAFLHALIYLNMYECTY